MTAQRLTAATLLLGLTACVDYKVNSREEDPPPGPDATTLEVCALDTDTSPVDTGSADCILGREQDIQVGPQWSITKFSAAPEFSHILNMPTFGDIDGDGTPEVVVVTDDDSQNGYVGKLRVQSGDNGMDELMTDNWKVDADGEEATLSLYRYSSTALGDIDSDGVVEIVVSVIVEFVAVPGDDGGGDSSTDSGDGGGDAGDDTGDISPVFKEPGGGLPTCALAAVEPDGSLDWVLLDPQFACGGHAPSIADMNGDGRPEVTLGDIIVDGTSGTLRGQGGQGVGSYPAYPEIGYFSAVADLDQDGQRELIAGSTVYDVDANVVCTVPNEGNGLAYLDNPDGFPGIADFDGDGLGEFVVIAQGELRYYEHDCSLTRGWSLGIGGNGGPPTIGDFDGDGEPEIGVAGGSAYRVFDADGTLVWSHDDVIDDSSHAASASLFDLEGDGRMELIYADEVALWILDGPTGDILLQDDRHTSRSLHEYPVVGDVDGDGEAEILVPNGGGHYGVEFTGLYLLESASVDWQAGRTVWNQHAYSITNINDDLSVPRNPETNWPAHNNFRSGDPATPADKRAPDIWPALGDLCIDCEEESFELSYRLYNTGALPLQADVPVSVYWVDRFDESWNLIETFELGEVLEPGRSTASRTLALALDEVPDGELVIVADDSGSVDGPGTVQECSETNNILMVTDLECDD